MFGQEEVTFKINSHLVTHNIAKKIQQQVEYYFSLANLITDHFLRNIINCSLGGWAKIEIFCAFKKINSIIDNQVSQRLTNGEKRTIIAKSCTTSSLLQVNNNAIRRINFEKGVKDFNQVLYCENINIDQFTRIIQENTNIDFNSTTLQHGNNWFFIEFRHNNTAQVAQVAEGALTKLCTTHNSKIIQGNHFVALQTQYAQILGISPYQCSSRQNEKSNYIQPKRIQSYQQVVSQQKHKKTKQIKMKRKSNRTRLPAKYILSSKQKKKVKVTKNETNHAFDSIPELKQERQKQLQETRLYQKKKMQQRLRKKAQLRKNSNKMDIEQQPEIIQQM